MLNQLIVTEKQLDFLIDCHDHYTCHLAYNEFMRNDYGRQYLPQKKYETALAVFQLKVKMEKDLKAHRQELMR